MLDTLIRIRSDVLATDFEGVTLSVMVTEGNVVLAHFTSTFVPKVFDLDKLEAGEKKSTIEKLHSGILKQPFLNTIGDEIGHAIGVVIPKYRKIERPLTRLGAFCFADIEPGKIYFDRVNDDIDHRILYECHVTKDLLLAVISKLILLSRLETDGPVPPNPTFRSMDAKSLIQLRKDVESLYMGVAALPVLVRQGGTKTAMVYLQNVVDYTQSMSDRIDSISHHIPKRNVPVPGILGWSDHPSAVQGAVSLRFEMIILLKAMGKAEKDWLEHGFTEEYTMLAGIAVEEINEVLRRLDAINPPPTDGPVSQRVWIHEGQEIACKLTPKAFKLARLVWTSPERSASFDAISESVFDDTLWEVATLRSHAYHFNRALAKKIGIKISVCESLHTCTFDRVGIPPV